MWTLCELPSKTCVEMIFVWLVLDVNGWGETITGTVCEALKPVLYYGIEFVYKLTCCSKVYCQGNLLHDAQMAKLYNDSKTFVDLKLKYHEDEIVRKWVKTIKVTRYYTILQLRSFHQNIFKLNGKPKYKVCWVK